MTLSLEVMYDAETHRDYLMTFCLLPAFIASRAWYPRRGGESGEMNRMKQGKGEGDKRESGRK